MVCCLNPNCEQPINQDNDSFCQSCGAKLVPILRNRYKVLKPLGQGGFGRTYLATDNDKLNEYCVVKQLLLDNHRDKAKVIDLFQQEAKQLQKLGEHSGIPTLLAYFEEDNYLYLVQQYIQGQNLLDELEQKGTFSEDKVWSLLRELLPILQFIHQNQVIHRDLKLENIMRHHKDGKLVIIDFGISKQFTETLLGKPGTVTGSYGYGSFEQMEHGIAYPASDLFSLGVTCFHLLTGNHPFSLYREFGYEWLQHWERYLKFSISNKLTRVLDRLLQKEFQNRYQSASQVLRHLPPRPSWIRSISLVVGSLVLICSLAQFVTSRTSEPSSSQSPHPNLVPANKPSIILPQSTYPTEVIEEPSLSSVVPEEAPSNEIKPSPQESDSERLKETILEIESNTIQQSRLRTQSSSIKNGFTQTERNIVQPPLSTSPTHAHLQSLLATEQWKEANQLTRALIEEDWSKLSCEDWRFIDRSWVYYSKGKFGFSVQRAIWQSIDRGGKPYSTPDWMWDKFFARVGWSAKLDSSQLTFDLTAPQGHLPSGSGNSTLSSWLNTTLLSIFEKAETCSL